MAGERQPQVAQRLILHLLIRHAHHRSTEEIVRPRHIAGEEKSLYLRQGGEGAFHHWVVRATSPQRLFVHLDVFLLHAPEHHRPQAPIAYWKCLIPYRGGLAVPECERRVRRAIGGRNQTHRSGRPRRRSTRAGTTARSPPGIGGNSTQPCGGGQGNSDEGEARHRGVSGSRFAK